jgi:hypothetical protein
MDILRFYEYVINNLNKIRKIFLNVNEGMKSLKIINSIYKSSRIQNMNLILSKIKDTYLGK